MSFVNDENLQGVVRSLYYDADNNLHSGVYETCDDAWLLVNINRYEKLISNATISVMTIDEAEELYGDEIIQRYLARQTQNKRDNSKANLVAGRDVNKRAIEIRKAKVISHIIQGYVKADIEAEFNICRSTIDKMLSNLQKGEVLDLYNKYNKTFFLDVSGKNIQDFISVDCSYSRYQKLLNDRLLNMRVPCE